MTRQSMPGIVAFARLLGCALLVVGSPATTASSNPTFEGVASCAGSTCHGRAEGNGAVVRQDEIAIWQEPSSKSGAHSRAFAVLRGRRSQEIAASLGLGAATSAPACLGCHTTYAPEGQRGARFHLSDGVGCESCHGASGGWLAEHYAVPASHASNVAAGLIPLERPEVRASVCLDCHYGSSKKGQFVTHSMMAAGHPRISFELDLFSALQRHHNVDKDYVERKGTLSSVKLWAVGQAEAVRRSTSLFSKPQFAARGMFPEFYFYDCHSCHRGITDGAERKLTFETNPGRPIPFGNPPFNDESIIMLSAVAGALVPGEAEAFTAASRNFHVAMGKDAASAREAARLLSVRARQLSKALVSRGFGSDDAQTVIARIAAKATSDQFTDYAGSVQAVMAVDTLLNSMVREGRITVAAAAGIRANISRAYDAVKSPAEYRPASFRSSLKGATSAIGALR